MPGKQAITGDVNITHYTVYDDVVVDDALVNIAADARLVFTGDDALSDDTFFGAGQIGNRVDLEIGSEVALQDAISFVNTATVVQDVVGSPFVAGEHDDDVVAIRNADGATWEMNGNATSSPTGRLPRNSSILGWWSKSPPARTMPWSIRISTIAEVW